MSGINECKITAGRNESKGERRKKTGTIVLKSKEGIDENKKKVVTFALAQPLIGQSARSPTVATNWAAGAISTTALVGNNILVVGATTTTKTISETGTTTRSLTVTLNRNIAMAIVETITIAGLTGT